jgi:transposase, IS30 family
MDHINSYSRPNLNDRTPYDTFKFLFGEKAIEKLGSTLNVKNDRIN